MARPTVSIVGCGRTGGSVALALQRAGYTISAVWSRSEDGRRRASALLDVPACDEPEAAAMSGELAVIAVPDDAIAETAAKIASGAGHATGRSGPASDHSGPPTSSSGPPSGGWWVVHTSGATSVDALSPLREVGARTGCLHPLQTLPEPLRGADALKGAAVAVTCAPEDRELLSSVAAGWGGRPFDLPDHSKVAYHAAAVFASNYVTSCVWAATTLLADMGVPQGHELLAPLVRTTVDNVAATGPAQAITGPVVRADAGVVRRHLDTLEPGATRDAYRAMARLTATLAGVDSRAIHEVLA